MGLEVEVRCIYRWMDILIAKIDVFRKKTTRASETKITARIMADWLTVIERTTDRPTDKMPDGHADRQKRCLVLQYLERTFWLLGLMGFYSIFLVGFLKN